MDPQEIRKSRVASSDGTLERRIFGLASVELRASDEGEDLTFEGDATVYDAEYEVFGGPPFGWVESVDKGAGKKSLSEKPDVVLLVNHNGLPLARTKTKTLELSETRTALHALATLEPEDPDVKSVRYKIERGDVDEMSFAFRVIRQEWNDDYTRRWIKEYDINRGDVSVVTYGANPATSVNLRAQEILRSLNSLDPRELMAEARGESDHVLRSAIDLLQMVIAEKNELAAPATGRSRHDLNLLLSQ